MKKELSPGIIAAVVVVVLAVAVFFLSRAATEKPAYPGQNAGHPTGEHMGGGPAPDPSTVRSPDQAVKAGFSGAAPGSAVPDAMKH